MIYKETVLKIIYYDFCFKTSISTVIKQAGLKGIEAIRLNQEICKIIKFSKYLFFIKCDINQIQ